MPAHKWRRRKQGLPPHWYIVNIGGQPGDVERAVKRTLAAVRADKRARLVITVSSLTGPGELWRNADFCERHAALGRRLAEIDPHNRLRIAERVPPECAALLAGQPDEARRLVLGPCADLEDADLELPLLDFGADFDLPADFGAEFDLPADFDLPAVDMTELFRRR